MKMFKKLAGVLTAAAVAAMTTVCAFAAPSPTAKATLKTAMDQAVTDVTITGADTTNAPEGAVKLKAEVLDLYDSSAKTDIDTVAKAANASVVEYFDVELVWVDANGKEVGKYEGTATVTFTYDAKKGDKIVHKPEGKAVETLETTVVEGKSATGTVSSLSPFAIIRSTDTASTSTNTNSSTNTNTSTNTNGSSSSQVLGAGVNMTTYVIIIAALAACAAVLGSVVILRKKH